MIDKEKLRELIADVAGRALERGVNPHFVLEELRATFGGKEFADIELIRIIGEECIRIVSTKH